MNVIDDETDEEIIMYICSFFNRLSCVKEKSYLKGINFREFYKLLKKSRNLILAKIMKMCKLAKFAKFNSREN